MEPVLLYALSVSLVKILGVVGCCFVVAAPLGNASTLITGIDRVEY
jgi:hypothetical protein